MIVTGNTQSCPESSSSSESTSSLEQDPVASPARSPDTTTLDDARGKFATFYCVFEQVVNSLAAGELICAWVDSAGIVENKPV